MARNAVAPSSHRDDHANSLTPANSKTNKRRCVPSACAPCRKRKSKCDGGTPFCATCTAVYKTECNYDTPNEKSRFKSGVVVASSALGTKRDSSVISASNFDNASSAEFIINNLRNLPEEQVHELVQHVRHDPNLDTINLADSWRQSLALSNSIPVEIAGLDSDLSSLLGKPKLISSGESRHFGHSSNLGLVPEDENFGHPRPHPQNELSAQQGVTWTTVTDDFAFVERLLSLYFKWSHPFYVLFSRECFNKYFQSGREKYCSSLLVNAICAYACHLTNEPASRTDPSNIRTAGDHFFAEARRLLFENENPSLTTVQALCVMALREASTGRDSTGFSYIGRCIRMCVELGLHLNNHAMPTQGLTPSEIEVRKVTFWGCFTVETIYSICTGRITQLPRAAITLDKPMLEEPTTMTDIRAPNGPATSRMFLQEFALLSELVNDNNYIFFAPKERLTSTHLINCYKKYQEWYTRLPVALRIEGRLEVDSHILVLHMLYYTVIMHLFRPILKMEFTHSEIVPRDICVDAANNVSRLMILYRTQYDFRTAHLIIPHILLSVCVVHLIFSRESEVAYENLVQGLQALEAIHECHYFGARSFRIIYSLARMWNLPWPEELQHSPLVPNGNFDKAQGTVSPPADPLLVAPNTMSLDGNSMNAAVPYLPTGHQNRRESLSMFGRGRLQLATHPVASRSSSSVSSQHIQSPSSVGHTSTHHNYNSVAQSAAYSYPQSMNKAPASVTTAGTSAGTDVAETLFWNPIPGVPGPILPRTSYHQMSPMGLGSVLHSNEMGDRLGRDGFRISEDWQSRHVDGFSQGVSGSVYGAHAEHNVNSYAHQSNESFSRADDRTAYSQAPQAQGYEDENWWPNVQGGVGQMS